LFDLKKWRPKFAERQMKDLFLDVAPKKDLHDLRGRKFAGKIRTTILRAS